MSHFVAPSLLSADFAHLARDVEMVEASKADWLHIDVMDGVFVPNISFGFPVLKAIKPLINKPLDVHLMIVEPERYIEDFKVAGADILTVHYEASTHLHRSIQRIKAAGMKAGVALNPHTNVNHLVDVLPDLDLVLVMSVNPGFGGQQFIENTLRKVEQLDELRKLTQSKALIEVDGGVSMANARLLLKAGVDVLVAGSFVFKSEDAAQTIASLKGVSPNEHLV